MTTNAFNTQGTLIKRGDGASAEVFTTIGEIKTFNGPSGQAAVLDATHLESTAREKLMGLPDEGQVTFTMNFIPSNAQQVALYNDRKNRTKRNFKIVFSDIGAAEMAFSAFVLGFNVVGGVDQLAEASLILEITGPITLTP